MRYVHLLAAASITGLLWLSPVHAQESSPPVSPFNGRDTSGWLLKGSAEKSHWIVGYAKQSVKNPGELEVASSGDGGPQLVNSHHGGIDIYSDNKFGDCVISLEFMIPKGSNSGVYVMGEYEVQIIDSFGKEQAKLGPGDIGGLYTTAAPRVNASKQPGEWQSLVIQFRAPQFAEGKKTANALFEKVLLNGQAIHENVEMKGPTPGGLSGKEAATGPLLFQGNHGPVAYRNIVVTPLR